jgi:hypothetical protein
MGAPGSPREWGFTPSCAVVVGARGNHSNCGALAARASSAVPPDSLLGPQPGSPKRKGRKEGKKRKERRKESERRFIFTLQSENKKSN